MDEFRFAGLPSNSSVAALVTAVACGWFLLAGGAILTDRHSDGTVAAARAAAPGASAEIPPEARFTIVVQARRLGDTL